MKTLFFICGIFAFAACQASPQIRPPAQIILTGSEWGTSVARQFVQFGANGKVTGSGGCNQFFGTYRQEDDVLHIGPIGSTKMACPNLGQEQALFENLKATRKIKRTHMKLVLLGEQGTVLLTLKRRDWD